MVIPVKQRPLKVMTIFGTRPEAIKMAPVVKAFADDPRFTTVVTVTAQHREMLDQVLGAFEIEPKYDLNIMKPQQALTDVVTSALDGLRSILATELPSLVLVHGDTITTLAASLAAFLHKVPVGHVEAGLRSNNPYDPFPEEMCRKLVSQIATLHFAPTANARTNLLRENVSEDSIFVVGNTVIDALLQQVTRNGTGSSPTLDMINNLEGRIVLLTTHRRENLGEPLRRIYRAVLQLLNEVPDIQVVFPMHKNPEIRRVALEAFQGHARVHLIEPPDYQTFSYLMSKSYIVMTDSGGIQEEAPSLGKPVLVLRNTTERPEGIAAGTSVLVGTETEKIVDTALELLNRRDVYDRMARASNPYGDGQAAQRIVDAVAYWFRLSEFRPRDYQPSVGVHSHQ